MKSSLESVSKLERRLSVQVPQSKVSEAFDQAYRTIQKQATIKGFRKGKAPLTAVKSMYGDRVKQDVVQSLVQKTYSDALKEHSLTPISFPSINFEDVQEGSEFTYTADFEVRPEVEVKDYKGLNIKKEKLDTSDERIDNALKQIRESRAQIQTVDEKRAAQKGDVAVIDFEGIVDGQPLENGTAKGHELELGSNSFIPGFEDGIVGMNLGETKDIELKFPEEYHAKDIAGKPVKFKTTLHSLKKKVLPELNDEFAKSLGEQFETVDALRSEVKKDMEQSDSKRIKDDTKNRILRALVAKNPIEVPKSLLEEQKRALEKDFRERMASQGFSDADFNDYKDSWKNDFEDTARFMIQSSFLIDKLAEKEKLQATEDEVHKKIHEFAAQSGIDEKRVSEFYHEPSRHQQLHYQVTEEKVINFLLQNAKVEEVKASELRDDVQ